MKIVFLRHGAPDYSTDSLTPLGKLQAAAAADVLVRYPFTGIYASERGRAIETASYIADRVGLPVVSLPFMNEIAWDPADITPEEKAAKSFHPWRMADGFILDGEDFNHLSPAAAARYERSLIPSSVATVRAGFDEFLATLGYRALGDGTYFCERENEDTYALFSHAGASSAVFSHLLGVPFLLYIAHTTLDFTGITEVRFRSAPGERVIPRFTLTNEHEHIRDLRDPVEALPDR